MSLDAQISTLHSTIFLQVIDYLCHNGSRDGKAITCIGTGLREEHGVDANELAFGVDEGTCGALVGAGIILGLATQDKAKSVKGMRQIMDKFKQRNGATQCKLLKGVGTGKVLRECPLCVADASEFLEEILEKEGVQK